MPRLVIKKKKRMVKGPWFLMNFRRYWLGHTPQIGPSPFFPVSSSVVSQCGELQLLTKVYLQTLIQIPNGSGEIKNDINNALRCNLTEVHHFYEIIKIISYTTGMSSMAQKNTIRFTLGISSTLYQGAFKRWHDLITLEITLF